MDIKGDIHLQQYLKSLNIKETTKQSYIKRLTYYSQFTGKTPTQLIEQAEEDEENQVRMKNRHIKSDMQNFLIHMRDNGQSPNYIKVLFSTIRSFYREFDIELPYIRYNLNHVEDLITTDDIISKKHILQVLKYCNQKYKAIVLIMMSSGMGSSEIRALTVEDFKRAYQIPKKDLSNIDRLTDYRGEIGTWRIRRYKTGMPYYTFNSPESTDALIDYIIQRYETNYYFNELTESLFVYRGQPMKERGFAGYFSRLNDQCNFGVKGLQRFFRSHGLRKFFASTCKKHGMDYLNAEWMLGHRIKDTTGAYIKPDISMLRNEYMKVLPHLSLSDIDTVTIDAPEVKELKDKNLKLEDRVKALEELYKAISEIKKAEKELK